MGNTIDNILNEVRVFFKSISLRKILIFSFFLLLSIIFWIMQVYRQKFEFTLTIPISYVHIPDSLLFDNDFPNELNVRVKDDGAALFKYFFIKRRDSLHVNINELIHTSSNRIIKDSDIEQVLREKLFNSSDIISYTPTSISYEYSILSQKKMPVIYNGEIKIPSGYMIDGDLSIYPDSVIAYGSKSIIDTMRFVNTVSDTVQNVISDTMFNVAIAPMKGMKYKPNKISIHVLVDEFTTKEINVPVECVNLPSNLDIKFFPSSVKIPVQVGLKRYNYIDGDCFRIKVDYNDIKDLKENTIPVRVVESPEYVKIKSPIPSEVEFVLEQK